MRKGFDEQDNKDQKNARINRILQKLVNNPPSPQDELEWNMNEPEFPTFPSPAEMDKARKAKKSPYL